MSDNMAANLVAIRGNRCTATILSWVEAHLMDTLSEEEWQSLRSVVIDQVNAFKDLSIDIVKSDAAIVNQFWVEKLDDIHNELRRMRG